MSKSLALFYWYKRFLNLRFFRNVVHQLCVPAPPDPRSTTGRRQPALLEHQEARNQAIWSKGAWSFQPLHLLNFFALRCSCRPKIWRYPCESLALWTKITVCLSSLLNSSFGRRLQNMTLNVSHCDARYFSVYFTPVKKNTCIFTITVFEKLQRHIWHLFLLVFNSSAEFTEQSNSANVVKLFRESWGTADHFLHFKPLLF